MKRASGFGRSENHRVIALMHHNPVAPTGLACGHGKWSYGPLCSQKGLSSGKSKSGIGESKVPSTCALDIANAEIAMGKIPI
jgi:hypothetical protein